MRLGAVGDVVRTLPAVSALRSAYAGAHVAWLVEPPSRTAIAGQPWVDEVLVFPRDEIETALRRGRFGSAARVLARFRSRLRRRRFDLVLDFHAILKSGLLARASGAPWRVGYAAPVAREGAALFANARARLEPARISRFARNRALVDFVAPGAIEPPRPWRVDPEARERLHRALGGAAQPVAIHPGTSPATPHKRWRPEAFAAVARRLQEETGVAAIVLHGPAPAERTLAAAIVAAAARAARLAPPTATLGELAALLSLCRLYVGGDSGPLHIASLVGTPVIQILGPTDPVENAPHPGTPLRTVRVPLACSPCRRGCASATCMRLVEPAAVVEAARALLARGRAGW